MKRIVFFIKKFFSNLIVSFKGIFKKIPNFKNIFKIEKKFFDCKRIAAYIFLFVTIGIASISIVLVFIFYFSKDLPEHDTLKDYFPKIKTKVLSSDGYPIAEYYRENRAFIPFEFIPKKVINAFLAAEDKNFYSHYGIDFYGLLRSIVKNIQNFNANKRLVGGSTITQQIAKNFFLGSQQSFIRKIKEAILAYRIEMTLTKERILEIYLNQFYFGQGCYGIVIAAKKYFNKSVEDLNLEEIAYLAALVKGANNYHPIKYYEKAITRRNWVLYQELKTGMISKKEYKNAIKKPLITCINKNNDTNFLEDSFVEEVRKQIVKQYGFDGLYNKGLIVRTTLNTDIQKLAKKTLQNGILSVDKKLGFRGGVNDENIDLKDLNEYGFEIAEVKSVDEDKIEILIPQQTKNVDGEIEYKNGFIKKNNFHWALKIDERILKLNVGDKICVKHIKKDSYFLQQIPKLQGAIVVMDHHNGHIIAMQGGTNFKNSEFNRAVQSKRQIGSLIKPFIYLTALNKGLTPATIINSESKTVKLENGGLWFPRNASKNIPNKLTLRNAIERSINTATLDVARYAGLEDIKTTLRLFNVIDEDLDNLSFLLGACEVSLLQIATSYCMIANGGFKVNPVLIDSVQNKDGKCIYKANYSLCSGFLKQWQDAIIPPKIVDIRQKIFDEARVFQMVSLLEGVVKKHSKELNVAMAGKTGTSNASDNLWFIGFTPDVLVAVFVGHDSPQSVAKWAYGSTVALPIFKKFIKDFYKNKKSRPFKVPSNISFKFVNPNDGEFAKITDKSAVLEAFKDGDDPAYYPEPDDENFNFIDLEFEYVKRIFKKLCNR